MLEGKYRNQVTSNVGQDLLFNRILTVIAFPLFGVFLLLKGKGQSRSEPVRRAAEARQPVIFEAGDHPAS
ncbi:hypothetical protein TRICHSKD4_5904 [Roseibium sp. TrichSKD4]|uniref:hypothetical protein n=1 Tax=Roseibium sp. TrichSKD4 TaxID=744980 RepID=UPI0001E576B6|nr:hypothetical protein [Roseibium sp. TrichSKD4]EFO30063.1 hypothetical protein TRICHSKD4_5904 [Roseibium sp. TrichSKD4]